MKYRISETNNRQLIDETGHVILEAPDGAALYALNIALHALNQSAMIFPESDTHQLTVLKAAWHLKGESPIYAAQSISIEIDDEGGGEFIKISSESHQDCTALDPNEVEPVFQAINTLLKQPAFQKVEK